MVGSIVYATEQGLGYLAKDFFDNGLIDFVYIQKHTSRINHPEWYGKNAVSSVDELLNICDTLIFFETPFDWKVIPKARELGIKTVLVPMYECTRYPFPYEPDEVWTPSALDTKFYGNKTTREIQIPTNIKWKQRNRAKIFIHNAGNGGLGGRNGTKELIEAMKMVKSDAKLIIRSQTPLTLNYPNIEVRVGTFTDIWSEGDVFIFPEKFNGLSLPIQEALASGMLVMATDRFPNNTYLPNEPLIPVSGFHKERISVEFDCADIDSKVIAKCIDEWYDKDITKYSLLGREYNQKTSWKNQKEKLRMCLSALSVGRASLEVIS